MPNAIKLVINPVIAPEIRSPVIVHTPKNATNVGTEMSTAINEPLVIRSIVVIFFAGFAVNSYRLDSAYKNQRCFIFGKTNFVCIE